MTLAKSKILKSPLRNSCLETNINIHKNIVYKMYEKIWIRYLFFFKNKFLKNKVWTKVRVFEAEGRQDTTSVSTPSFFREYFSPPSPPPPAFNQYSLSPSSCSSLLFSSWGKIKPHPIASTVSSPFTLFHLTLFIFLLLSSFPCHFRYLLFRTIFHREKRFSPILASRFDAFIFISPPHPSISTFHLFFHLLKFLSPSFSSPFLVVRVINIKWNDKHSYYSSNCRVIIASGVITTVQCTVARGRRKVGLRLR